MQAVYLGLAIILGGGLVLFGVGAGNGLGGLLNAFTGKGSSSGQTQAVSQQEKAAIKATQANPASAAAWAALIQASSTIRIMVHYFDTWINHNEDALRTFFGHGGKLYIVLPDPNNDVLVDIIHGRFRGQP